MRISGITLNTRHGLLLALVFSITGGFGCQRGAATPPQAKPPVVTTPKLPAFERVAPDSGAQQPAPQGLLALADELNRAKRELDALQATKPDSERDSSPYFIGYELFDLDGVQLGAKSGSLVPENRIHLRALSAEVRVGSYALDSTHPVDDSPFSYFGSPPEMVPLDPEDDRGIRQQAFRATSRAYHNALERYQAVRAGRNIKVDIEDKTGDFSPTKPVVFIGERAKLEPFDASLWHEQLRKLSARLASRPEITDSTVLLDQTTQNRWILTSEGTKVQTGEASARLTIHAEARADDGMDLTRDETLDAHQLARLPDAAKLEGLVTQVADDLVKLRQAPLAEPYVGPAILVGRAAAVMFHEIFGHRVEGERQKEEDEAQTFAKKVGETVTSDFIDIYDDPTLTRFGGIDLLGHYRFDDEGIAAEPVSLISAGKLQGFLLSRVPVRGKNSSNGHGRRMIGSPSVHARQGNLVIQARQTVPFSVLRERLIAEAKRQSRPYGLLFAEISGGLTQTARGSTQGFKVTPVMVYRVYVDGRKDELIRGVDIVGTPLTGLTKILAASDDYAVFNGSCGAESGWVSVSAISPSLLIGQIEVALREKGNARPPVLPPPALATR